MKKSHQVTGHASTRGTSSTATFIGHFGLQVPPVSSRLYENNYGTNLLYLLVVLVARLQQIFDYLFLKESKWIRMWPDYWTEHKFLDEEYTIFPAFLLHVFTWMMWLAHGTYQAPRWGCVSTTRKNDGSVRTQSFWSLQITGLCILTDIFSLNYTTHTLFHDTPHAIGWLIKVTGKLKPSYRMVIIFCMYLE